MRPPKINKPSELPNPVLHFGSDVYQCENRVRRLFKNGAGKISSGENDIKEGLRLSLKDKVPTDKVLNWLVSENVRCAKRWASAYERVAQQDAELVTKVVASEMSFTQAVQAVSRPKASRSRESVGRRYIHQLAIWTYRTGADLEEVIRKLREEFESLSTYER
jgi:hypothetical protein